MATGKRTAAEMDSTLPKPRVCRSFPFGFNPRYDICVGLVGVLPEIRIRQPRQCHFILSFEEFTALAEMGKEVKEITLSSIPEYGGTTVCHLSCNFGTARFQRKLIPNTCPQDEIETLLCIDQTFEFPETLLPKLLEQVHAAMRHVSLLQEEESTIQVMFSTIQSKLDALREAVSGDFKFNDIFRVFRQTVPTYLLMSDFMNNLKLRQVVLKLDKYSVFEACLCQIEYLTLSMVTDYAVTTLFF